METVKLVTRTGDFVTEANIPPFQVPAEVLNWGSRYFMLDHRYPTGFGKKVYSEVLCFVVPTEGM